MTPHEKLRNEIITLATRDYRAALRAKDGEEIKRIEKFFRSPYYEVLCDIDPEWLIKELRKEQDEI